VMKTDPRQKLKVVSERSMKGYQWKRIHLPYRAPLVFDCRFDGAAEQIVQQHFQTFLNCFTAIAKGLKSDGLLKCKFEDLSDDIVAMLKEAKEKGFDSPRMFVRLQYHRQEIAKRISKELGRDATGDVVRRMGIGDQLVLIGVLQAIERDLGAGSLTVIYDPLYPGCTNIMAMSGLNAIPLPPDADISEACPPGATVIDQRRHILEHPTSDNVPCYYGEQEGSPSAQFLWNLGWETHLPHHRPGDFALTVPESAVEQGLVQIPGGVPYATCQPLELTRQNVLMTSSVYSAVLQMMDIRCIVFGCGPNERPKLEKFVADMRLPKQFKTLLLCESLPVWLSILKRGAHHVSGNTSGMWFGFWSGQPLTILERSDDLHGTMWNVKAEWFSADRWESIRMIV